MKHKKKGQDLLFVLGFFLHHLHQKVDCPLLSRIKFVFPLPPPTHPPPCFLDPQIIVVTMYLVEASKIQKKKKMHEWPSL